jgi:hypothetical protein
MGTKKGISMTIFVIGKMKAGNLRSLDTELAHPVT